MIRYSILKDKPVKVFTRLVGINKTAFLILAEKVQEEIKQERESNPKSKRGRKSTLNIEDQLILCMIYLRSYPTFIELGESFAISEGYANKVFHKMSKILIKILKLPSNTELTKNELKAIVVDASEQPIERPIKKQKEYYSGKKNIIR